MDYLNDDSIKKYEPFWGSWYIEKFLGQGSFGKVFKIFKEEWGFKYESALKIISIPSKDQYHEAVTTLGNDEKLLQLYFEDAVKSIINEIVLLYNLRGNSNIVSYEDHKVEKHEGKIAWDILIRMEYLTPLNKYLEEKNITVDDAVNIGLDICAALELCSKKSIVHRDIKDDNIFVSKDRRYKLGDFGIARELSKGLSASIRGTPLYMAPEVYKGETYDTRSDLYSLGILLYKLLNAGRFPFMPPFPMELRIKDTEAAVEKRLSGETFPPPCNANQKLGNVILKLCEYRPENRFATPSAVKEALIEACYEMSYIERQRIILSNSKASSQKEFLNSSNIVQDTVLLNNSSLNDVPDRIPNSINKSQSIINDMDDVIRSGNTSGNILNGGLACIQGEWTFLSCPNLRYKMYKISRDEKQITKLNSDESWFINVVGNWIYYSNSDDGESIYRMSIDGSEKEKITSDSCWYLNVFDDWIYYSSETDDYKLYKIRTDGSERTKLNDDKSINISLYESSIYYSNNSDGGKMYRINIDGREKTKISYDKVSCYCLSDNWIYFCNKSDGMKLYKMDILGTKTEKLSNDVLSNINVYNGWIYYCNKSDMSKLYRIREDGSERTKLNDDYSDYISIIGDWIFYCNKSDGNKAYKIRPDGLNRTAISIPQASDDEWIYI